MILKIKKYTNNGLEYFGNIKPNEVSQNFGELMKKICDEMNVSIYWSLKTNGEFLIIIDFCEAKICTGTISDD